MFVFRVYMGSREGSGFEKKLKVCDFVNSGKALSPKPCSRHLKAKLFQDTQDLEDAEPDALSEESARREKSASGGWVREF